MKNLNFTYPPNIKRIINAISSPATDLIEKNNSENEAVKTI